MIGESNAASPLHKQGGMVRKRLLARSSVYSGDVEGGKKMVAKDYNGA
jgi:hypothetical protein